MSSLTEHLAAYRPELHLGRLMHIALRCPTESDNAVPLALSILHNSQNTNLYRDFIHQLASIGKGVAVDEAWVANTERANAKELDRLQVVLGTAQTSMLKESMRLAFNDIADFYFRKGDLPAAMKSLARQRDSCTTNAHIVQGSLRGIRYNLERPNYNLIAQFASKAEQALDKDMVREVITVRIAQALVQLDRKSFRTAAFILTGLPQVDAEACAFYFNVSDLALMASITALATFTRAELQKNILENQMFKVLFETELDARNLVMSFYECRYDECLKVLEAVSPRLELDIFMHPHAEKLSDSIRKNLLKQYTLPFISVDLVRMAKALNTPLPRLEKDLASLIRDGGIKARIDTARRVLVATETDHRARTVSSVLHAGDSLLFELEETLRQLSMLRNDIAVKSRTPRPPTHGPAVFASSLGGGRMGH